MKQTQFPSLNKLLETMEKEIMQSDPSPDSFPTFNPLLWLSSPDRTYVADASGICLQDTSEVFRIFAHELCEKLEAFSTLMTARENPAKYILVLCEIMRLLPLNYIANTGSLQILHIIQVRFNTFPEVYSLRFIPAIKLFIANAVAVGANPLKLVYHQVNGEFTPCEIVEQLSYAMFSRDSFIAAFKGIDNIIPDVTPEIRPKFLAGLYSLVSRFFIDCPTDHEELIKTGFPELENLIDKLCKNKSKIEPELIAIIAAFMPMCHNGLKEACENKKSNLFTTIAGKCKNSKERGSQKKFYMTCAIIELLEAKVICSKLDGNPPFKEFMEKFGDKIKEPPTTVKFIESFSKEQRINVFPRIVSISLANNSDPNLQSSILLDLVKEDSGWPLLLETLQYVLKGYPISGYLPQLPSLVYEKLISSLREYMETIKNKDADSISRTVALQTASKILDYFTSASPKFTLYSILSSQDVQTTPAEVPNYFNPTEFMKFDHKASDTIQVFHRQSDLVKNIIRLLAETGATNTQSFILFLQTFFTFNKRLVEGIKNQIILEEIIEIARTFQSELKIGIRMNSPNVVHFPVVYSFYTYWKDH
ncbi:hypothetical protein GPJ56_005726 [Histomonas meleagridis]|uniref:uncharacterized protein n=1 Tax=Histomonas meleagridis TaxID=135588 RepID=UPI00355A0EDF|nr:hypothetical protein GPJ56_005726 [Histomonas meleagridis]KAH0803338.1 hypothetical protein GO595_003682 [Histomonas meleagridis]